MARVVIVDDHPAVSGVVRDLLESAGHDVVCCQSAESALEEIARNCPDVLITDQRLQGISGTELLQQLSHSSEYRQIYNIVWSADDNCCGDALEAGAAEFWEKGSDELFGNIDALVDRLRG